mmetsp:Transcript_42452/g.83431  ORF Transcript_42452/g.83431 Transcript_42452/m.83431 type:complete len:85 (+) Transcript_42452:41-295(+)
MARSKNCKGTSLSSCTLLIIPCTYYIQIFNMFPIIEETSRAENGSGGNDYYSQKTTRRSGSATKTRSGSVSKNGSRTTTDASSY